MQEVEIATRKTVVIAVGILMAAMAISWVAMLLKMCFVVVMIAVNVTLEPEERITVKGLMKLHRLIFKEEKDS